MTSTLGSSRPTPQEAQRALARVRWIRKPVAAEDDHTAGGVLNLCYNAIDRHVVAGRSDECVLVADEQGRVRTWTYAGLLEDVAALAGALRFLGVAEGSAVPLLLPPGPELLQALLAAWRLGAVAYVLPPGSEAAEVAESLVALAPPVLLTAADAPWTEALSTAATRGVVPGSVVVRSVPGAETTLTEPRDLDWGFVVRAGRQDPAPCARRRSQDPAYAVPGASGWDIHPSGDAALRAAGAADALRLGEGVTWWAPLPVAGDEGVTLGVLAPLISGAALVVSDAASPEAYEGGRLQDPIARAHHVTATVEVDEDVARQVTGSDGTALILDTADGARTVTWSSRG